MIEQKIEALTAAVLENTAVTNTLIQIMSGAKPNPLISETEVDTTPTAPANADVGKEVTADTEASKPPKRKRRTKAEIEADKKAEAEAAAAATAGKSDDVPAAPTQTVDVPPVPQVRDTWAEGVTGADEFTPLIGRLINGVAVPEGVALGMEAEWYASKSKAETKTEPDVAEAMSKEDARAALTAFVNTKGGAAIGAAIAEFAAPGKTFDEIPADRYAALVARLEAQPDQSAVPPAPAG